MPDTPLEITISTATFEDVDEVTRLEEQAFPSPWRRIFFLEEVSAASRYNNVARDSAGNLVGYLFAMHYGDEMHINKIAVVEHARRLGLATRLMSEATAFANEHQVRTIALEVRQSNAGAIRFYERLGFVSIYKRANYYPDGEAAVVMMVAITPAE